MLDRVPQAGEPSTIVAEPLVPVPGDAPDFQDESTVHDRRDVLCFTTNVLRDDLVIVGSPVVRCATRADQPAHDVVATLCTVGEDGTARVVSASAQRALIPADGEQHEWSITLRPLAVRAPRGSRLRLTLAASRFPCFDRNPHTGDLGPETPADAHRVATIEFDDVSIALAIASPFAP